MVIVIDAADNSVTGAKNCIPEQTSFIHEFLKIGSLPENIRFVVTSRTGNLPKLILPEKYKQFEIKYFDLAETRENIQNHYKQVSESDIEDFHALSNNNPRVQSYAFEYAGDNFSNALGYLQPNGKGLDDIFETRFKEALKKSGSREKLESICSALIVFPSPVPKPHLANVLNMQEQQLDDILSDLPGLRDIGGKVGFQDEDVEFFIRQKAKSELTKTQLLVADYFLENHTSDEYCSINLAGALHSAKRGERILEIIQKEPFAIRDQIIRREVHLSRLQLAMKFCRSTGKTKDAIFTLLIGAEARKTEDAVDKIITENPGLSVHFAADTVGRKILRSSENYDEHGRFLAHSMAKDASKGDLISYREKKNVLDSWFGRRYEDMQRQEIEQKDRNYSHIVPWPFGTKEIVAVANAVFDAEGSEEAYEFIRRFIRHRAQLSTTLLFIERLIKAGKAHNLIEFLDKKIVPEPWASIISIPLALVGHRIDCDKLTNALINTKVQKLLGLQSVIYQHSSQTFKYKRLFLQGCEVIAAQGSNIAQLRSILLSLCPIKWRELTHLNTHNNDEVDIGFRAFALLSQLDTAKPTLEDYWIEPKKKQGLTEHEERKQAQELADKRSRLKDSLSGLFDSYMVRAQVLTCNKEEHGQFVESLQSSIKLMHSGMWRTSRRFDASKFLTGLALAVCELASVHQMTPKVLLSLAKSVFEKWPLTFYSGQIQVLDQLVKLPELTSDITADIFERCSEIQNAKTSATEKTEKLVQLSKVLFFADQEESVEIFKIAIEIAGDIDIDAMNEISLLSSLSHEAVNHYSEEECLIAAKQMADVVTNYGIILDGQEHFPWNEAISSITGLNLGQAFVTAGYWNDLQLTSLDTTISSLVLQGTQSQKLAPSDGIAALNLCEYAEEIVIQELLRSLRYENNTQLVEEIAKYELLRFARQGRPEINKLVGQINPAQPASGFWQNKLNEQIEFRNRNNRVVQPKQRENECYEQPEDNPRRVFLESITAESISLQDASSLLNSIESLKLTAREQDLHISESNLVLHFASVVSASQVVQLLDLLSLAPVVESFSYDWARTLSQCISLWTKRSLRVLNWKKERFPELVRHFLPEFAYDLGYGQETNLLPKTLSDLDLRRSEVVELLLDGIENCADRIDIAKLYDVLKLLASYCDSGSIADVHKQYLNRLTHRLNLTAKAQPCLSSTNKAFASLIYSLLGDVDTRVRWQAAHTLLTAVKLGNYELLNEFIELYDFKKMHGLRDEDLPFYWISARLWLAVTLDRISSETPQALAPLAYWILKIATDSKFPHTLFRCFAKSCLVNLLNGSHLDFDEKQRNDCNFINVSKLESAEPFQRYGRDSYSHDNESRRFRFDALDTLRYIYPRAIESFANIDGDKFLDEAEKWIVDQWAEGTSFIPWVEEPRKNLFDNMHFSLYNHGHGATPTIEPYSYYLEWNAMWCSVGSLMATESLSKPEYEDDDYGTLNGLLRYEVLSSPPQWASDIRGPTPTVLDLQYPTNMQISNWLSSVDAKEFDKEIGLSNEEGRLTVDSRHYTKYKDKTSRISVSSALVAPEKGMSLIRALQTSIHSFNYCIPPIGHELEIDKEGFVFRGWIQSLGGDPLIDQNDTFANGVRKLESCPSSEVTECLNLKHSREHPIRWFNDQYTAFTYEAWGDEKEDSSHREYIYNEDVVSDGHQLKVSVEALYDFLNIVKLDLVLEVEINREVKKNGYSNYDEDSERESRYARLYLLKRTGEVFTVEGCVGSWLPPG